MTLVTVNINPPTPPAIYVDSSVETVPAAPGVLEAKVDYDYNGLVYKKATQVLLFYRNTSSDPYTSYVIEPEDYFKETKLPTLIEGGELFVRVFAPKGAQGRVTLRY
jgi:hypothetical protein